MLDRVFIGARKRVGVDTYIIPCNYISQFNNAWLEQLIKLSTIGEEWKREHEIHNDVLLTVACSSSIISNQEFSNRNHHYVEILGYKSDIGD